MGGIGTITDKIAGGFGLTWTNKSKLGRSEPNRNDRPERNRRSFFDHLDSSTISFFFTHFPSKMKVSKLWQLFNSYGVVGEVFVPKKLDKWGKRFGFVKFKNVTNMELLELQLEEVWWGDSKLKVNKARFGMGERFEEGRSKLMERRGLTNLFGEEEKKCRREFLSKMWLQRVIHDARRSRVWSWSLVRL